MVTDATSRHSGLSGNSAGLKAVPLVRNPLGSALAMPSYLILFNTYLILTYIYINRNITT